MTTIKKSAYRVQLYSLIEEIAGRKITAKEHEKIKEIVVAYVQTEADYKQGIEEAMQKQGQKLREMRKHMLGTLHSLVAKKDIDEKKVKILQGFITDLTK